MDRVDAEELLHESIQNANLRKHCYAAEDVLRGLARHFGQNEELWAMTGLVHDIDYELTAQTPERHGATAADWLTQRGYDPALVRAVQSHNPATGVYPTTLLEKALYCADPVTGFIVAAALVKPTKKLADVDVPFLMRKFGEKSFARGAGRDQMRLCGEIGLDLTEFLDIALVSMQSDAERLGL